ncbi:MAG: NTP transferase domain-containing protein [Nitrospinaceae bacterium]
MQAVILLAGYGSRLNRPDLPHKSLLPFGNETLLSRHLCCLQELKVANVRLVLGHNKEQVKAYVRDLDPGLPLQFVDNDRYLTTGNTLSMVMGLRGCEGDVLVLDGDVLYPRGVFQNFVQCSPSSSFALAPVDIDNEEASKVLLKPSGTIQAFITKRRFTAEEKNGFQFGGEAIGFFKLSGEDQGRFLSLYSREESRYEKALWEIPLTDFAREVDLHPWDIAEKGCFEIDTPEDYEQARAFFESHRQQYV